MYSGDEKHDAGGAGSRYDSPGGDISPDDGGTQKKKEGDEKKQEALMKRLDAEGQRELEDLLDELGMLETMQMEEVYTQGMRMGAQLAAELLDRSCK